MHILRLVNDRAERQSISGDEKSDGPNVCQSSERHEESQNAKVRWDLDDFGRYS